MAIVLHDTEYKALELLCNVDQIQENIDTLKIADDVNSVQSKVGESLQSIKKDTLELKTIIQKLEDQNDTTQADAFVNI